MTDDSYERKPGLAAERTELARSRSALALIACGAAVVKGLPHVTGRPAHPAIGLAMLILGGVVWIAGLPYARPRTPSGRDATDRPTPVRQLALLAVGTAIVGVAAFAIAAFLPS